MYGRNCEKGSSKRNIGRKFAQQARRDPLAPSSSQPKKWELGGQSALAPSAHTTLNRSTHGTRQRQGACQAVVAARCGPPADAQEACRGHWACNPHAGRVMGRLRCSRPEEALQVQYARSRRCTSGRAAGRLGAGAAFEVQEMGELGTGSLEPGVLPLARCSLSATRRHSSSTSMRPIRTSCLAARRSRRNSLKGNGPISVEAAHMFHATTPRFRRTQFSQRTVEVITTSRSIC